MLIRLHKLAYSSPKKNLFLEGMKRILKQPVTSSLIVWKLIILLKFGSDPNHNSRIIIMMMIILIISHWRVRFWVLFDIWTAANWWWSCNCLVQSQCIFSDNWFRRYWSLFREDAIDNELFYCAIFVIIIIIILLSFIFVFI